MSTSSTAQSTAKQVWLFTEYSSLWRLSINDRHKLEYSVNNCTRSAVDCAADCHLYWILSKTIGGEDSPDDPLEVRGIIQGDEVIKSPVSTKLPVCSSLHSPVQVFEKKKYMLSLLTLFCPVSRWFGQCGKISTPAELVFSVDIHPKKKINCAKEDR